MRKFCDVFKELLRDRKLTHRAAAEALNAPLVAAGVRSKRAGVLDFRQISRWANGKNVPNAETLCVIADFFMVTVDFLLGRSTTTATTLGDELSKFVATQLSAAPVWTPAAGGRVARTQYVVDPSRLLRFVVASVRASEIADRQLQAQEGTTMSLYSDLRTAAQSLENAGKNDDAKHYRRTLKRVDKAFAEQLAPKLIRLFDAPADAPLPALTISTAPAA